MKSEAYPGFFRGGVLTSRDAAPALMKVADWTGGGGGGGVTLTLFFLPQNLMVSFPDMG